jgi:uncharacterized protein (TIGR00106 family)
MVLMEFSIAPFGRGESLSKYVARVIDIVRKSKLPYKVTSMGTIVEGEWNELLVLLTQCFRNLKRDNNRIGIWIKIDYRKGRKGAIVQKVEKVEKILRVRLEK